MALSGILNDIFPSTLQNSFTVVKEKIKEGIRNEVRWAGKFLAKKLMGALLISFSILLFSIAFIYALKDYAGFSNTFSFLILGVILLLAGIIVYLRAERREKHG